MSCAGRVLVMTAYGSVKGRRIILQIRQLYYPATCSPRAMAAALLLP